MTSITAPEPIAHHWEKIAFYLRHALSAFGDPAKLAQALWISARDHKLISAYLRPLEHLVRQLIFIAALDLAPMTLPPTPERKYRARLAMPTHEGATFDPAKPETWRVSFKLSPDSRAAAAPAGGTVALSPKQAGKGAVGPSDPRISSAPSAERLEALIRAYENRDKLAAALARTLARDARIALAYVLRRKRRKTPPYVALDFTDLATEAHQRHIHRKLDALRTDSS